MPFLKYYFGHDGNKLFFDCVVCKGEEPVLPDHFLKWYEEGDFAPLEFTESQREMMAKMDSPLLAAAFAPRRVNFSVEELLTKRKRGAYQHGY